jgi:hypothetical protein
MTMQAGFCSGGEQVASVYSFTFSLRPGGSFLQSSMKPPAESAPKQPIVKEGKFRPSAGWCPLWDTWITTW